MRLVKVYDGPTAEPYHKGHNGASPGSGNFVLLALSGEGAGKGFRDALRQLVAEMVVVAGPGEQAIGDALVT